MTYSSWLEMLMTHSVCLNLIILSSSKDIKVLSICHKDANDALGMPKYDHTECVKRL